MVAAANIQAVESQRHCITTGDKLSGIDSFKDSNCADYFGITITSKHRLPYQAGLIRGCGFVHKCKALKHSLQMRIGDRSFQEIVSASRHHAVLICRGANPWRLVSGNGNATCDSIGVTAARHTRSANVGSKQWLRR